MEPFLVVHNEPDVYNGLVHYIIMFNFMGKVMHVDKLALFYIKKPIEFEIILY